MSPWIRTPIIITVALAAVVVGAVALPFMWAARKIEGLLCANAEDPCANGGAR